MCMLTGRIVVTTYWTCTFFGTKSGCSSPKVGILTRYWICSNCSTHDIDFDWVILATYLSFFP